MYDAFEDIPAIILRTQALRARFPGNVHLENHAIESYQTLLGAITDLIALLLRPIDGKWCNTLTIRMPMTML